MDHHRVRRRFPIFRSERVERALINADLHQLSYARRIDGGKRIGLQNLQRLVWWNERARIVAAQFQTGLSQVVRAEREELWALSAISSAVNAPRGTSIIVPTE